MQDATAERLGRWGGGGGTVEDEEFVALCVRARVLLEVALGRFTEDGGGNRWSVLYRMTRAIDARLAGVGGDAVYRMTPDQYSYAVGPVECGLVYSLPGCENPWEDEEEDGMSATRWFHIPEDRPDYDGLAEQAARFFAGLFESVSEVRD